MENYKEMDFTRQKKHCPRIIVNTFKEHFVNLANDLVKKRPDSTGKLGLPSVRYYYKEFNVRKKKVKFEKFSSISIFKMLK